MRAVAARIIVSFSISKFCGYRKPIKSLPKPLAGYVFSRNQRAIDGVLQSLSFGGGAVNQTNIFLFIESVPYGGVGTSGIGNYYGKYGYDSHARQVDPDISAGRGHRSLISALRNF